MAILSGEPQITGVDYNSTITVVAANGHPYYVYGQVNEIGVKQGPLDPCNPNNAPARRHEYASPTAMGQITLTAVSGDVVTFTTAVGSTGQFNYVTGQYAGS